MGSTTKYSALLLSSSWAPLLSQDVSEDVGCPNEENGCVRYSDKGNVLYSLNGLILWHKFNRIRYKYVVAIVREMGHWTQFSVWWLGLRESTSGQQRQVSLYQSQAAVAMRGHKGTRHPNLRQVWQKLLIKLFLRNWQLVSKFQSFYVDRKIPWRLPTVDSDPGLHESTPCLHMLFLKNLP